MLFQAGPEHPWLIKTYSEVAPHPCAQALGQEFSFRVESYLVTLISGFTGTLAKYQVSEL